MRVRPDGYGSFSPFRLPSVVVTSCGDLFVCNILRGKLELAGYMHQGAACLCGRVSLPLPDNACFCS
jgi:hypothetical protein